MKIIRCLTLLPVISSLFAASSFAQDISLGGEEYSISVDEVGSSLSISVLEAQPWYGSGSLASTAATEFAAVASSADDDINGVDFGGPFFVSSALGSLPASGVDASFYPPGGPAINTGILIGSGNYVAEATLVPSTVPDSQSTFSIVLGISLLLCALRRFLRPHSAAV